MTLTLLQPGEARPVTETLADGAYIVGRGKTTRIQLPFSDVSERHALIMVRNGQASVEDLKSANGTYVDGQPIDGIVSLSDDSIIQIGSTVLRITSTAPATARDSEPTPPAATPSAAPVPPPPTSPLPATEVLEVAQPDPLALAICAEGSEDSWPDVICLGHLPLFKS